MLTGTGGLTPAPGSHTAGDLLLTICETDTATPATPTGYTLMPCSPVTNFATSSTRLTIFYKVAASGSETGPVIADPGDHLIAVTLAFRDVDPVNFFNQVATMGSSGGTITNVTFPAVFTTVNDCLVLNVMCWGLDNAGPLSSGETNASLGSLTERIDAGGTDANGGGLVVITGTKAVKGEVSATVITLATSTAFALMTIALQPPQAAAGSGRIIHSGAF